MIVSSIYYYYLSLNRAILKKMWVSCLEMSFIITLNNMGGKWLCKKLVEIDFRLPSLKGTL